MKNLKWTVMNFSILGDDTELCWIALNISFRKREKYIGVEGGIRGWRGGGWGE